MKKITLLLLLTTALIFAYTSNSFRYSSTGGILWDDYDWFLQDPARIPNIEGARLYTNLANFVSGYEQGLADTGWMPGHYLIGGKAFGPPLGVAGVVDLQMVRIPDPTGIGDFMGCGTTTDTNYTVDPSDGSITGAQYITQTADAYHTVNDLGGYLGLGYATSETFSLGFSFAHGTDNIKAYAPAANKTEGTWNYDHDTLVSYDTTFSFEETGYKGMSNRVRLGIWTEMDYLEISGYLGANLFSGSSGLDTLYSYSLTDQSGPGMTAHYDDKVTNWPYSGLGIPLELLGIYEIDEGQELWFSGGVEYRMWKWKDGAGERTVNNDTTLSPGPEGTITNVSMDTTQTLGTGSYSGLFYNAGVKGVFALNEKVSFGLGLRILGSSGSDSTFNENTSFTYTYVDDGDGVGEVSDVTATTLSSNTDYEINKVSSLAFDFPVGVEFKPVEPVALRLGAIFTHQMNTYTTRIQEVDARYTETYTQYGDGTSDAATSYETSPGIGYTEGKEKETINDLDYEFGIGFAITENFQLDLAGFTNLRDMSNWRFSVIFKFY
ncbi:hypothetical protein JXM67_10250 [candidate division WOR-3 bacterium]|nr:hypothetical protein [candidate division WOR-3 bacterium]